MSMRERVARAIHAWVYQEEGVSVGWDIYLPTADAVLAAMETPTPAMFEAWRPLLPRWSQWEASPRLEYPLLSGPSYAWKVAIRAARDGK